MLLRKDKYWFLHVPPVLLKRDKYWSLHVPLFQEKQDGHPTRNERLL